MVVTIITWLCIFLGSFLLLLLWVPFRINLSGQADDREGSSYKLEMDWAFGLITIRLVQGEPVTLFLFGCRIWRLSIKSLKKEMMKKAPKKKKTSIQDIALWIKRHFQQIAVILKRFARAVFLRGYFVGWIGLPDPADTARIGLLSQLMEISKERFKLTIICVYDQEIIKINGRAQITLIIGYLGLIALIQLLKKDTRLMIRGLART